MESNGKKVIIVDEQPNHVAGLKNRLLQNGYEVYYAADGDKALALVREIHPDIILSEVKLPQLDGLLLLQTIRNEEQLRQIPFVFLSNQKRVEERIRCIQLGADDYIPKPYFVEEVIARIELILTESEYAHKSTQPGSFSGKLSEMNLVDLIQTLEIGKKSGILTLRRNGKQGQVQIQAGNVINAQFENFSGEDALERMFTWTEGLFQVILTEINTPKQVKLNNKELVEHGLEKVNRWERLKTELPSLNAVLALAADPKSMSLNGTLSDNEKRFLALVDGKNAILDIVEQFQGDDVLSLEIIHQLFRKGLVKVYEIRQNLMNPEQKKNSQYIKNIQKLMAERRPDEKKELSVIRSFFSQPLISGEAQIDPNRKSTTGQSQASPWNHARIIQKNRIYLTKSELMMIREKLM